MVCLYLCAKVYKKIDNSNIFVIPTDNIRWNLQQEDTNNNLPNAPESACSPHGSSPTHSKSAQMLLEMRTVARKFNIAAANPLLAEKLSTPSGQHANHTSASVTYPDRQQLATLGLKVEKGKSIYCVRWEQKLIFFLVSGEQELMVHGIDVLTICF